MVGVNQVWCCATNGAFRLKQVLWIQQLAALIALVSLCFLVAAVRAGSHDESVGQSHFVHRTVELLDSLLLEEALFFDLLEKHLHNFRMLLS